MLRITAVFATALLVAVVIAGPAAAAKPGPPTITSVTVVETGGAWPYCEQTATVTFHTGPQPAWISMLVGIEGGPADSYVAKVRRSGTIDISVTGHDYSASSVTHPNDPTRWHVHIWNQFGHPEPSSNSGYYFDDGACPGIGDVLASWTAP